MLQLFQFRLYGIDGLLGVFAPAHDDYAAYGFSLTVQFRNAAAQFRPLADLRHIGKQNGGALFIDTQGDITQVFFAAEVSGGAHHIFRLRHFDDGSAGLLVRALDGAANPGHGNAVGADDIGVHHHLVLLDHTADGGDLRHSWNGLQFVLQKPVLN